MQDNDDDRAAILAVLEAETDAYLRRDYDAWESYWLDSREARRIHSHVGTGVTVVDGPAIRTQMRRLMSKDTDWVVSKPVERNNLNLVISAEMAWVTYEQVGDMSGELGELAGRYHELKILHKVEGAWKIACVVGHQMRIDHVSAPLIEIDESGRVLWMNAAAEERLKDHSKLRLRGNRLLASDPDAQTDLLSAANWIAAIRDRHTPLVTSDAVTRGIALGQDDFGVMQICWATLRDGKLLIAFDDQGRLNRQIGAAIDIYGLSGTQGELVRHIVTGSDIAASARGLGISPNTAKTHLQRIYDKTGVRTQSALVRLVLSAERGSV